MGKFLLCRPADCCNHREEHGLMKQLSDQPEWLLGGESVVNT